jgi:glutamate/tyrosine decarboxylase-like PLP-dependent enzyme
MRFFFSRVSLAARFYVLNMFSSDGLRQLIATGIRHARAFRNCYRETGCTNAEMRGIKLLKEWLTPEQLTQYESHRYLRYWSAERRALPHPARHRTKYHADRLGREGRSGLLFRSVRAIGLRGRHAGAKDRSGNGRMERLSCSQKIFTKSALIGNMSGSRQHLK